MGRSKTLVSKLKYTKSNRSVLQAVAYAASHLFMYKGLETKGASFTQIVESCSTKLLLLSSHVCGSYASLWAEALKLEKTLICCLR